MPDKIFYTLGIGFLSGVLLRSFIHIDIYWVLVIAIISLAIFLFFTFLSQNKPGTLLLLCILAICLGIFRFHITDTPAPRFFESKVNQRMEFEGVIVDEPNLRENNQHLIIEAWAGEHKTNILIYADFEGEYKYGDEVRVEGVLKKPENFTTDQGKEFDYVNYLRKDGILYVMSYPEIEVISEGNGNLLKDILFSIKQKFLENINQSVKSPESLLLGGLILGEKASFPRELRQDFVDTGTIHIVALSGYNVTIVAEWFMKIFSFLPFYFSIGSGILAIGLFVLMSGAGSTAVRAGIMAALALIARATGRSYDVGRALMFAGVAMVFISPLILRYDVSFQLSVLATIAVIFFAPRIEKYFSWVPAKFKLRDIVSVTVAAYIFVLPFILYKMGNFSVVALPANILILPLIPITMAFGFFTGLLGMIHYTLAFPPGYLSYILLHYELETISFFADLPFASFTFPHFPLILTLAIYLYFGYFLFGKIKINETR